MRILQQGRAQVLLVAALVAALVTAIGCESQRDRDRRDRHERWRERQRQEQMLSEDPDQEQARLAKEFAELLAKLDALESELSASNIALNNAQNEADRKAALDRLVAAQQRKAEAAAALARKQAEMREAERWRRLGPECRNNPLGC